MDSKFWVSIERRYSIHSELLAYSQSAKHDFDINMASTPQKRRFSSPSRVSIFKTRLNINLFQNSTISKIFHISSGYKGPLMAHDTIISFFPAPMTSERCGRVYGANATTLCSSFCILCSNSIRDSDQCQCAFSRSNECPLIVAISHHTHSYTPAELCEIVGLPSIPSHSPWIDLFTYSRPISSFTESLLSLTAHITRSLSKISLKGSQHSESCDIQSSPLGFVSEEKIEKEWDRVMSYLLSLSRSIFYPKDTHTSTADDHCALCMFLSLISSQLSRITIITAPEEGLIDGEYTRIADRDGMYLAESSHDRSGLSDMSDNTTSTPYFNFRISLKGSQHSESCDIQSSPLGFVSEEKIEKEWDRVMSYLLSLSRSIFYPKDTHTSTADDHCALCMFLSLISSQLSRITIITAPEEGLIDGEYTRIADRDGMYLAESSHDRSGLSDMSDNTTSTPYFNFSVNDLLCSCDCDHPERVPAPLTSNPPLAPLHVLFVGRLCPHSHTLHHTLSMLSSLHVLGEDITRLVTGILQATSVRKHKKKTFSHRHYSTGHHSSGGEGDTMLAGSIHSVVSTTSDHSQLQWIDAVKQLGRSKVHLMTSPSYTLPTIEASRVLHGLMHEQLHILPRTSHTQHVIRMCVPIWSVSEGPGGRKGRYMCDSDWKEVSDEEMGVTPDVLKGFSLVVRDIIGVGNLGEEWERRKSKEMKSKTLCRTKTGSLSVRNPCVVKTDRKRVEGKTIVKKEQPLSSSPNIGFLGNSVFPDHDRLVTPLQCAQHLCFSEGGVSLLSPPAPSFLSLFIDTIPFLSSRSSSITIPPATLACLSSLSAVLSCDDALIRIALCVCIARGGRILRDVDICIASIVWGTCGERSVVTGDSSAMTLSCHKGDRMDRLGVGLKIPSWIDGKTMIDNPYGQVDRGSSTEMSIASKHKPTKKNSDGLNFILRRFGGLRNYWKRLNRTQASPSITDKIYDWFSIDLQPMELFLEDNSSSPLTTRGYALSSRRKHPVLSWLLIFPFQLIRLSLQIFLSIALACLAFYTMFTLAQSRLHYSIDIILGISVSSLCCTIYFLKRNKVRRRGASNLFERVVQYCEDELACNGFALRELSCLSEEEEEEGGRDQESSRVGDASRERRYTTLGGIKTYIHLDNASRRSRFSLTLHWMNTQCDRLSDEQL
ncbi:hypothetical protein ADUPG1_006094 [Aduncisulcus paluster]|uniref:Uncharacterized protein n=1 Tax=Aduncisulcus paluster TaxID=2918883 RepID=A0ABQ5KGV2_9EUKA|nr:hypothetical protein ADUPG1_006094 [Aduncisulcus paluster]